MFRNYVNSMLSNRPFQPLFDADNGSGGTDTKTDTKTDDPNDDQGGADDDKDPGGKDDDKKDDNHDDKKDPVTFSDDQQQFINNLINKTIKEERTKAEKERQKELDRQKMNDDEKREADLKDAQDKLEQFKTKSLTYEIKDVAREMGVPANKVDRFLKLVDREDVDVDDQGNVDRSMVQTVVKAVLGDFPEFKANDGKKGPGSDFDKGSNNGAKYSLAQIKDMSQEDIAKNWDDVQKSMAIHNKPKK